MSPSRNVAGRTAVVTGAASGIGRAIALCLAKRGCNLALADMNEAGLAETQRAASSSKVNVTVHRLNVADRDAVAAFPSVVKADHNGVDLLFNNAGVALGGTFDQVSERDFEWLFEINFWGVVRMTRAFLPALHASSDACLINVSSIFGIVAPPGQTAYSASKFAVRGFSNALRNELTDTKIGVLVVHPGGVATSIARNARLPHGVSPQQAEKELKGIEKFLRMPPEKAGEIIVRAVEKRKARVLVGNDAKFSALLERLMPVAHGAILKRLARTA